LAASNGYLDRDDFMISPHGEALFQNTITVIEIAERMMGWKNRKITSISIPASVETLSRVCFGHNHFDKVTIPPDSRVRDLWKWAF
jgi:hypothetical protein